MLKNLVLLFLFTTVAWATPGEHLKLGETITAIRGVDQFNAPREFSNLTGPEGLVVVIFRSADW